MGDLPGHAAAQLTELEFLVRLVAATAALAIVPGALVTLLWKPRPELTMLEATGFGMAISFGLVQVLAMLAIALHLSPSIALALHASFCVALVAALAYRGSARITFPLDEIIFASVLIVLGALLYRLGSPVEWFEDQVHAAIVRRLSALEAPRLDNIYFAPGIVYTYPFPGTHYFMALVARLGDVDPLFVYHKLRFFWGPAALVMLYLFARAAFGSTGMACGVAITAAALVFSGAFAMLPGFPSGWGQLIPFSHASDVAMTVLLPSLIVAACGYLLAATRREKAFFLAATTALALMLTIVHIRDIVQAAAYLGCFLVASLALPRFRPYAARTAALLGLIVAIAAIYGVWQAQSATLVSDVVASQRARLGAIASSSGWQALLFTPAPELLGEFVLNSEQAFAGLTPLFLFAGPAVLLLFAGQPIVWLVAVSTVVYLLVTYVPLLAIPYIYVTYFEILFTPVRNVILFVYLLAGASLYATVCALARIDRTRVVLPGVAGMAAGALALLVTLTINQTVSGFVAPLVAAYCLALAMAITSPSGWGRTAVRAMVAVVMLAGLMALWPQRDPVERETQVAVRWSDALAEAERAALERQFSLNDGEPNSNRTATVNVWNYALTDTSEANVRALVTHPQVRDTGGIDRTTFEVPPQPPVRDHPHLAVAFVPLVQYPGAILFVLAAAFIWVIGFVMPAVIAAPRMQRAAADLQASASRPFHSRVLPYACFIIPFAVWTAQPTLSPVAALDAPNMATPAALLAGLPCLTTAARPAPFSEDILNGQALMLPERTSCPPDQGVVDWIRRQVPADAIFAIDRWNPYLPSVFIPQQVVVYPQVEVTFEQEDELFAAYHRFYSERLRTRGVQPFFNDVETPAERAAFVEALDVTHILVDPPYYGQMRAVLDAMPGQFALRYSGAEWAVYEVLRRPADASGV